MRNQIASLSIVLFVGFLSSAALANGASKVRIIYPPNWPPPPPVIVEAVPGAAPPPVIVNVNNTVRVRVNVYRYSRAAYLRRKVFQNYPCFCRGYSGPRYPF